MLRKNAATLLSYSDMNRGQFHKNCLRLYDLDCALQCIISFSEQEDTLVPSASDGNGGSNINDSSENKDDDANRDVMGETEQHADVRTEGNAATRTNDPLIEEMQAARMNNINIMMGHEAQASKSNKGGEDENSDRMEDLD